MLVYSKNGVHVTQIDPRRFIYLLMVMAKCFWLCYQQMGEYWWMTNTWKVLLSWWNSGQAEIRNISNFKLVYRQSGHITDLLFFVKKFLYTEK